MKNLTERFRCTRGSQALQRTKALASVKDVRDFGDMAE